MPTRLPPVRPPSSYRATHCLDTPFFPLFFAWSSQAEPHPFFFPPAAIVVRRAPLLPPSPPPPPSTGRIGHGPTSLSPPRAPGVRPLVPEPQSRPPRRPARFTAAPPTGQTRTAVEARFPVRFFLLGTSKGPHPDLLLRVLAAVRHLPARQCRREQAAVA
jgi:hypothetical protein